MNLKPLYMKINKWQHGAFFAVALLFMLFRFGSSVCAQNNEFDVFSHNLFDNSLC